MVGPTSERLLSSAAMILTNVGQSVAIGLGNATRRNGSPDAWRIKLGGIG